MSQECSGRQHPRCACLPVMELWGWEPAFCQSDFVLNEGRDVRRNGSFAKFAADSLPASKASISIIRSSGMMDCSRRVEKMHRRNRLAWVKPHEAQGRAGPKQVKELLLLHRTITHDAVTHAVGKVQVVPGHAEAIDDAFRQFKEQGSKWSFDR